MSRLFFCVSLLLFLCLSASELRADPPWRAVLQKHCVDCHGEDLQEADLRLDAAADPQSSRDAFLLWSQVHGRVRKHEMPPRESDTLTETERNALLDSLGAALKQVEQTRIADSGRSPVRRLNRVEYQNTLRDVLAAPQLDVLDMLPPDGDAFGYDKSSSALEFSQIHVEKWMDAASAAVRSAVAPTLLKPKPVKVRATIDSVEGTRNTCQGLYSMLKQQRAIPMVGRKIDRTLKATRGDFAKRDPGTVTDPAPKFDGLAIFINNATNLGMQIRPFQVQVPGRYTIRVHGYGIFADKGEVRLSEQTETIGFYSKDRTLGYCDLPAGGEHTAELTVWLEPDDQVRPLVASSTYDKIRVNTQDKTPWKAIIGRGVVLQWFELEGPFYDEWPPRSHQLLFGDLKRKKVRSPDGDNRRRRGRKPAFPEPVPFEVHSDAPLDDATKLLSAFLPRAVRRPVTNAEVALQRERFAVRLAAGDSFQEALLKTYADILAGPDVLLLSEPTGELDAHSLASRLSYFLHASPPDEPLRAVADDGTLTDPQVLRAQVDRLLDDPKSERFVEHFLDHWLDLDEIELTEPDQNLYPDYNPLLLDAMLDETHAYFAEMIAADLPASYVVDSEFSFLNERLAELYDVPGVTGTEIRKVSLPDASVRGGLLTQASILKTTANGTTTSPVERGAFVMTKLLGDPPPPPPPTVPAVEPDISGATTIREQLAKHREIDSCAACHKKIDPPGFALESFDVMGGFRTKYRARSKGTLRRDLLADGGKSAGVRDGLPVDASGVFDEEAEFDSVEEFREILLSHSDQIGVNLLEQLTIYATGSPFGFADADVKQELIEELRPDGFRLRQMIHALVQSDVFRRK